MYQPAKGRELDVGQAGAVRQDLRQGQVRIQVGITMAGKVLGTGHHTGSPQPLCPGQSALAHRGGIGAKRPIANDGVVRVAVHIHHRGEVHVDAQCAQLVARDAPSLSNQVDILNRAQGHRLRKPDAVREAHSGTPFCIHGRQQAQPRGGHSDAVELFQVSRRGGLVALHGDDAPHAQ